MAELRIVTWNLQGSKGVDALAVSRLLGDMTADGEIQIVALQEVQRRQARALARAWGAKDWRWARKHLPYGPFLWWRAEGLAVLANADIDDHKVTTLTPTIRIWSYRRRIVQSLIVDHPHGQVAVFNTHLASHDDPGARSVQAAIVAGQIAERRTIDRPEVLSGDLNAPDEPATLLPFTGIGLRDAWRLVQIAPGFTNPSGAPYQRLDYVLTGTNITVLHAQVAPGTADWPRLSDHLPLLVSASIETGTDTTTPARPPGGDAG